MPPDRAGEGAVRVRLAGRAERNRDRAGCARWPEVNVGGGRRPGQVLEDHVPGKRALVPLSVIVAVKEPAPEAASFALGASWAVRSVAFRA